MSCFQRFSAIVPIPKWGRMTTTVGFWLSQGVDFLGNYYWRDSQKSPFNPPKKKSPWKNTALPRRNPTINLLYLWLFFFGGGAEWVHKIVVKKFLAVFFVFFFFHFCFPVTLTPSKNHPFSLALTDWRSGWGSAINSPRMSNKKPRCCGGKSDDVSSKSLQGGP